VIEVAITYDLLPDIDQDAYFQLFRKAVVPILQQPGIIEIRSKRSLSGSPQVLVMIAWETMADWNRFEFTKEWTALIEELKKSFVINMKSQIWGPSPIAPEPLRPLKFA
jgi:heme-degrading monooxygenase HmoA